MGSAQLPKKYLARRACTYKVGGDYRSKWDRGSAMALDKADARRARIASGVLAFVSGIVVLSVLLVIFDRLTG